MKRSYFYLLTIISTFLFVFNSFGQIYYTDFENYTAGEQLACQDTANWTTFSLSPCDPVEDGYVTTNYAYSGTKSFVILYNNDVVKPLGDQTSGIWPVGFDMMIPSGKAGYFNLMSGFTPNPYEWAIEVFFPDGGTASVNAGGTGAASFGFPYDTWFHVEIIVDLDNDSGELFVNGTSIYVWPWTFGSNGNGGPLMLSAADFFGYYTNNEMYVDNFYTGAPLTQVNTQSNTPATFSLNQNYPNPFNPTTTIGYSIQSEGLVTLKVFNILGKGVARLVDGKEEPGNHSVTFNASTLPSGIYLYTLTAGNQTVSKKLILLK